jgi:Zinc finger, C2H2 type
MKCPECSQHIASRLRLKQHLDQEGATPKACSICQLPMPNECSLKAHERLHNTVSALQGSYMCPECGLQFGSREMLLVHIHQDCMHGFLIASFQCMHCDRLLSSSISLEAHLLNEHTEKVYKCTQCHLVDQTIEGINDHIFHNHLENNKVNICLILFKMNFNIISVFCSNRFHSCFFTDGDIQ